VAGPSTDTISIISEFAAAGAVAVVASRLTFEWARGLSLFTHRSAGHAREPAELSDAQFLGEALAGALVAGYGAAWYLGALDFMRDRQTAFSLALLGFACACGPLWSFAREPLPGDAPTDDETHVKAWLGWAAAASTLAIAACDAYR